MEFEANVMLERGMQFNGFCHFQVVHFLLGLMDDKRLSEDFRHCWPILKTDKKAETQFRKAAFAWYKQLQVKNLNNCNQVHPDSIYNTWRLRDLRHT